MSILLKESIKFKYLTLEELIINIDRLTRFKLPELSYTRVFHSIILKNLITPKYSQNTIENIEPEKLSKIVKEIWNKSVCQITNCKNNKTINKAIKLICNYTYKNISEKTKEYINTDLNIAPILEYIDYESACDNIKFLIKINELFNNREVTIQDLISIREKYSLKFPISKLVIVEGITEEILLPVFAAKLQHNFNKEGIYILGAGGKSKSPALYMELKNRLKIPVNILFDSDAKEVYNMLQNILLKKDKAYIIEKGEFEDILSENLIKRTLNNTYEPVTPITIKELHSFPKMCDNIENFYKTRNLGEFKKSKVSKIIAENIKYDTDITEDIKKIITYITKPCIKTG